MFTFLKKVSQLVTVVARSASRMFPCLQQVWLNNLIEQQVGFLPCMSPEKLMNVLYKAFQQHECCN